MLQEIKDLQNRAVSQLVQKANGKEKEITFRAPTGSGKTYMMADFMNRVLRENKNIIFLVSSLSKGGLAKQNYEKFLEYNNKGMFQYLEPYLITSEISGEEELYIPTESNVYVLPRDLYKNNSRLKAGGLLNFLQTMTSGFKGKNKQIYVIKDECHVATKNLDELSNRYFTKVINFSATPKLNRNQYPDVEITDEEAVNAKLIKHVEMGAEEDTVEMAINKFEQIKKDYRNLIGVNPCLIIQISNKDKAEEEWKNNILPVLNKTEHQDLKWMVIVDKSTSLCDTNDIVKKTLSIDKWKDYAKSNLSTIDIIVFKMVISEGWDIPRACMLYQVRDTQSKQLDEQVMGRVRRTPRLLNFETLSDKAKQLATTAWVWGIAPESIKRIRPVKLVGGKDEVKNALQIKTIRIKPLTKRKDFNIEEFLNKQKPINANESLFTLQRKLASCDNEIQEMCYFYADTISKWFNFTERLEGIKKAYNNYVCNYDESMETDKNDDGTEKIVSFPLTSSFMEKESNYNEEIDTWVWRRKDNNETFSFDSEAERMWADVLLKLSYREKIKDFDLNTSQGQSLLQEDENKKYLWGKNFLFNSEIRFQYYHNGIHSSYPDFIMKDKKDRIHIFEVKSVNISNNMNFDTEQYNEKITALKECYKHCSKLLPYNFYLPMYKDSEWQITRYSNGEETTISKNDFKAQISE